MSKKVYKKPKVFIRDSRVETNISSIENSFLNETSFNSDVDIEIRQDIEKKFKKSIVNSRYVFPRNLPIDFRRKKSPIRPKQNLKPKLLLEKSLPVMHKATKSTNESTGILSHLTTLKKIHKATSSIKSIRETKIKLGKGRNNQQSLAQHRATSSTAINRSKSPIFVRKETSLEPPTKHRRAISTKRNYCENTLTRPKSVLKKPAHLYTTSMESIVPSAIIKCVSYY